jgi:hypothetical protein
MICKIIVFVLLYCLISGKYKDYITIKVPIPGINAPFVIGGGSRQPNINTVYKTVYEDVYTPPNNPVYKPIAPVYTPVVADVYTPVQAVQSLF